MLTGTLSEISGLDGKLTISGIENISADYYTGAYTVRPELDEQSLNVKNKTMKNNITIEKIPIYAVSNEQEGTTIVIG